MPYPDDRVVSVTFLPMNVTVRARRGDTLLDAALENDVEMAHECGGNCACTTCHVLLESGMENLSPMEEPEDARLDTAEERAPQSRLGCQALLRGGPVTARIIGADSAVDSRRDLR
jgi:2Fe-2S ferredoxin